MGEWYCVHRTTLPDHLLLHLVDWIPSRDMFYEHNIMKPHSATYRVSYGTGVQQLPIMMAGWVVGPAARGRDANPHQTGTSNPGHRQPTIHIGIQLNI